MSETKSYTLEEVRDAFLNGVSYTIDHCSSHFVYPSFEKRIAEGMRRYPSPKKLREVKHGDTTYRVRDGQLECARKGPAWLPLGSMEYYRVLADLIAHPYENEEA